MQGGRNMSSVRRDSQAKELHNLHIRIQMRQLPDVQQAPPNKPSGYCTLLSWQEMTHYDSSDRKMQT